MYPCERAEAGFRGAGLAAGARIVGADGSGTESPISGEILVGGKPVTISGPLQNGSVIVDIQPFWQQVVVGAVLSGAVYADQRRRSAALAGGGRPQLGGLLAHLTSSRQATPAPVFGAGPTGLLLSQLIARGGAVSVTVAASSDFKLKRAEKLKQAEERAAERPDGSQDHHRVLTRAR